MRTEPHGAKTRTRTLRSVAGWELEARPCGPQTGAPCLSLRPEEAGRGWRSLPGGLVDTAAAGRALLSRTKLLFSEAPSSPGLEPVEAEAPLECAE